MAFVKFGQQDQQVSLGRYSTFVNVFCVVAIVGQVSLILTSLGKLPPQVPIFYSRPWGEDYFGPSYMLFILPGLALVFYLVNNLVSLFLAREQFLRKLFLVFNCLICFLTVYSTAKVISLLI